MSDRIETTFERLRPAISHLSQRKVLLAYTTFARRFESLFPHEEVGQLVLLAEQVAEGERDLRSLLEAKNKCLSLVQGRPEVAFDELNAAYIVCELGFYAGWRLRELDGRPSRTGRTAGESIFHTMLNWLPLIGMELAPGPRNDWFEEQIRALLDIARDVGGDAALDPGWLTSTVTTLARQMYDSRDFSLMPILADALQDAGCEDAAILDHCRGENPHVRGCWVVDRVLGLS